MLIMKKWTRSLLAMLLVITMVGTFSAQAAHAEELDNSVIHSLIQLPTGTYNTKEAQAMIGRIERIPAPILTALNDTGTKIILTNDIITNVPELNYLKGVTPRGWEKTGLTWDDVPGVSEKDVVVRIGYSQKGKGHNSYNLEIHETMHAVDRFVFNSISSSQEFKDIFNKEASINYKGDGYFSVYPEEYFAEAASMYVYNDNTRKHLQETTPLTYAFFDKLFNK
jgi:Pro-Pro endopeptidase